MSTPSGTESGPDVGGRCLHPGVASGPTVVLREPVSFWGGVSAQGVVIDPHHPQCGVALRGTVLMLRAGRGSSSSSSVLAEQIRSGQAPAAILLSEPDIILTLGAIAAAELYDIRMPIVLLEPTDACRVRSGRVVEVVSGADACAGGAETATGGPQPLGSAIVRGL